MKGTFKIFSLAMILALIFNALAMPVASAVAAGPQVAMWGLDGDFTDSSINGYHGTLFQSGGFPTYSPDVPTGGGSDSLQFNGGAGYGSATLGNEIAGNHTFTVSFWMKYVPQTKRQWMLLLGNATTLQGVHWLIDANGMSNIGVFDGGGNIFDLSSYANQWVKVTTVYYSSASRFSTYVNGQLMSTTIASTPNIPTSTPARLGWGPAAYIAGGDMYYAGLLDEVEIYDCVYNVTVFNTNDSGTDSLRQALADVCDGGLITIDSSLAGLTTGLTTGELMINKNVTIDGSAAPGYTISGNNITRVFNIPGAYNVVMNALTIADGNNILADAQGCWNGNPDGGGICNNGNLTVTNSTFINNHADYSGGAIAMDANGSLMVANSAFSGNSASDFDGGAIANFGDATSVNVINSTFDGNTVDNPGNGGGIFSFGPLTLANTIIANSGAGGDCVSSGSLTSINNLIQDGSCLATLSGDPMLNALAPNGGPTQTMSLKSGSPALGAGSAATCAAAPVSNLDQRGQSRPQGDPVCDIGAYESNLTSSHTVTFYANGGTGSMSPQTASTSTPLTLNGFTPPAGSTFSGWDTSSAGTTVVYTDGQTYSFAANADLYAVWAAIPAPAAFTKSSPADGSVSAGTSVTLNWSASAGATSYEYCIDETPGTTCTTTWLNVGNVLTASQGFLPANGTLYWQVRAVNASATKTEADGGTWWTFVKDNTAPQTFIDSGPAALTNSTSATFTFHATDNYYAPANLTIYCGLDGAAWQPCTSPHTYNGLSEGSHYVYVMAFDPAGNTNQLNSTGPYDWTVDTTAPGFGVVADNPYEATGPGGANAAYNASFTDVNGIASESCTPASGSLFPLGITTVNCTGTDNAGNIANWFFDILVVDTTAPSISVPGNMTVEATGPSGAVVTYSASASDVVGMQSFSCLPSSGSTFPIGSTTVNCTGTDTSNNTANSSFDIIVVDTTAPTLNLPGDITVPQTIPAGALVSYTFSATDIVDGQVAMTCIPASGSTFPLGTTTVTCSATDSTGNPATGAFTVTVTSSGANLLLKPDFGGVYVFPYPWAPTGITAPYSNSIDCKIFVSESCSARITGNGRMKAAAQTLRRPGLAGDQFAFGMSSRAMNVPEKSQYKIEVLFYDRSGKLVGSNSLNFTRGTHEWESLSGVVTAPANYSMIRVRFVYQAASGKAWFDDAFLYQIP